jgi:prlF antitoxin for toxin YhaV_toxin
VIAPGQMLVSVHREGEPIIDDDPVLDAFLGSIADDIARHPERLQPLSATAVAKGVELISDVDARDDDIIPDDGSL